MPESSNVSTLFLVSKCATSFELTTVSFKFGICAYLVRLARLWPYLALLGCFYGTDWSLWHVTVNSFVVVKVRLSRAYLRVRTCRCCSLHMMRFKCNSEMTHARLDCVLVSLNHALGMFTAAYGAFVKAVDLDLKNTTARSAIQMCQMQIERQRRQQQQ